jgi:prepilin-type N-terminal cleavage/methylation domain-containing protein/prepilin-type processing-associated H-X9-DG protein
MAGGIMKPKKNSGFTLIELLVVIAIIALLLSILSPGLKKAKDTAKRVVCGTRLRQVGVAMKLYSDAFDGALPDDRGISGSRERHAYAVYRSEPDYVYASGKLKPLRLAYLYELNYVDVAELFYCPGNRLDQYKVESYTHPTPWGTLPQTYNTVSGSNQWVRIGYTYYPVELNARIDTASKAPAELAAKYIRLNPNLPYATDVLHGRVNLSHQSKTVYSVNALFPDGHVAFCNDQAVFRHSVWDPFDAGGVPDTRYYDTFYYTVFRMIRP